MKRSIRVIEGRGKLLQAEVELRAVGLELDQNVERVTANEVDKSDSANERTVLVDELLKFGFRFVDVRHTHAFDTDLVLVVFIG